MNAELIAVGSEMLQPGFRDTNSTWLAGELARSGILVRQIAVLEDDAGRIADAIAAACERAEVVLVTGGLGPTADDRTREGMARALGVALETDDAAQRAIVAFLAALGRRADRDQLRQALRPCGTVTIPNPVGTAPGILAEREGRLVAALPGVPAEMRAMFAATIEPRLEHRAGRSVRRRILRIAGRTESAVDSEVRDLYDLPGLRATILAKTTGIELILLVEGATAGEAEDRLEAADREFAARLGPDLFGRDEDTLPAVLGRALLARGATIATAESCTGGLLGATITEVPGSSAWYRGGLVVYADDLKSTLAGVGTEIIARRGAVSPDVAEALARAARERCEAEFGIAITGIAGPSGGTPEKPVGLVFVGLASAEGARSVRVRLGGGRDLIRRRSVTQALDLARRAVGAGA